MKYILILSILTSFASASEDQKSVQHLSSFESAAHYEALMEMNLSNPSQSFDFFNRTKFIMEKYFGFAPEPSHQSELNTLSGKQSLTGFNKLYKYFDKEKQFDRFTAFDSQASGTVHVYQDRDVRQTDDYNISLTQVASPTNPFENFKPTANQPLAGLRIALDPGHMGGKIWDERTGKYVTDHHGHTISEGVINLQTCLLLKDRLEKEGAVVLITHENIGPVTDKTWSGLNLRDFIPSELYSSTLEQWFIELLEEAPIGNDLSRAFAESPDIKKLFSEEMRHDFFVVREDIDARANKIKAFNADLTLVVHYDTSDPKTDPNGVSPTRIDYTKVYVPGGFEPTEFASRAQRRDFAKHIFNPFWWDSSVSLAKSLSLQLRSTLKLKGDKPYGEQVQVDEGVLTRNLSLTRQLDSTAIAYVECLFYNDPLEFAALLKADNPMTIGGVSYPYSNRLKQVVDALEAGVLKFAANVNGI